MISVRRMSARDTTEKHRASTPLELLFDLTFVVAIAQLVTQLAHAVAEGHVLDSIGPFAAVFFAVWWGWNQFTWIASAYDVDDVPYRVCTMIQMGGVLIIAAGVPHAFDGDFLIVTIGYLVMRMGLVAILVRASLQDKDSRDVSARYALGISVVQAGWLLRLLLPPEWGVASFVALVIAEFAATAWADHGRRLAWHPHHIAERYGLFVIIILGESVTAATLAVQSAVADGVSAPLVLTGASALVILFSLWWIYFEEPAADGLVRHRSRSYFWGYGHFFLFAALAAVGAGLEIAVESTTHHLEASDLAVGYALAVPVALVVLLVWVLHAPLVERPVIPPLATVLVTAVVLLTPLAAPVIGTLGVTIAIALELVVLVAVAVGTARASARPSRAAGTGPRPEPTVPA